MAVAPASKPTFKVWAANEVVYGPVDIPTLVQWAKEERVLRSTWLYAVGLEKWIKAAELPELSSTFRPLPTPAATPLSSPPASPLPASAAAPKASPAVLRKAEFLASLTDAQLVRLVNMMEIVDVPAGAEVVRKDGPGDAMFAVLEGELKAKLTIGARESTLATYRPGDIFGELSLFDDATRASDLVASANSKLLKVAKDRFRLLCESEPDLASPFLFGLAKSLAGRVRNDKRRMSELVILPKGAK